MKALPDVWQKLPQKKQDEVIDRLRARVENVVSVAVRAIASSDRAVLVAKLEQVNVKEEVKGTMIFTKRDARLHDLIDSAGQDVLVVVASEKKYLAGIDEISGDPDQGDMIGA